jgi:DNA-binding beta-propeller fold protein YncE
MRSRRVRLVGTAGNVLCLCFLPALGLMSKPAEGNDAALLVLAEETATRGARSGSLVFVSPETYQAFGSVDLGLVPAGAVLSPDERIVYVFAAEKGRGPGGTLAVVDIASRRLLATVDGGEAPWPVGFSPDGSRLYCMDSGTDQRKASFSALDRATHARLARIELPGSAPEALLSPDGTRIYVLLRDEAVKDAPWRLGVIDTRENTVVKDQPLGAVVPGHMVLSPDKQWVYVLDFGNIKGDAADSVLHVLDASSGDRLATLPVGAQPTRMAINHETGSVYVGARARREAKTGFVLGIRGRENFGRLDLADRPSSVRTSADGKSLFVVGERSVSLVDMELKQERSFSIKLRQAVTMDGRRAAVASEGSTGLTPLLKLFHESVQVSPVSLAAPGRGGDAEAFHVVALGGGSRFLYGLDTLGSLLYVVNTQTQQAVAKVAIDQGAYELFLAPHGRHLYVKGLTALAVIDTSTNAVVVRHGLSRGNKMGVDFGRFKTGTLYPRRQMAFSDARRLGFLADGKKVNILNLRTGAAAKVLTDLPSPLQVLVPASANVLPAERAAMEEILDRIEAFEAEGKVEDAAAEYRKAQALAPANRDYITRPLMLYLKAGKEREAFAEVHRWLDQAPSDSTRCWVAASLYMRQSRYGEAVPLIECTIAGPLPPEVPPGMPRLELARGYLALRNFEAALRNAEEARRLGEPRADAVIKQIRAAR